MKNTPIVFYKINMAKKELFITEDGVKVYDGDLFWNASWTRSYKIGCIHAHEGILDKFSKESKNFSTKKLAEEWFEKTYGYDQYKYLIKYNSQN